MNLAARLDKLLPGLSVRERVVLILRAQAAGEEPDAEVEASDRLRALLGRISSRRQPAEPTEDLLANMRDRVEVAFGHFGLRETRE